MLSHLLLVVSTLRTAFGRRADLLLEIAALRHQVEVLNAQVARPRFRRQDRMFWIWLCRQWPRWKEALVIVQPETVLRWHREGYRRYWRRRSGGSPGRPRIPRQHIAFIRRISTDHPEWGEDRIALEMKIKLGVDHSTSTIRRYMVESGRPPKSTWRRFLASHAHEFFTMDFATQVMWDFSTRYILIIMALDTREVVHFAVTGSPTLGWVKRQLREATPWGEVPRFLLHDNDGIFGQYPRAGVELPGGYRCALDAWLHRVLGIQGIPIPYGAPNAQAHIERFIGTLRRECLEHFIFLSDDHLRRTTAEFSSYYNSFRPHQGLMGIPAPQEPPGQVVPTCPGVRRAHLISRPILGGLHHDYSLAA